MEIVMEAKKLAELIETKKFSIQMYHPEQPSRLEEDAQGAAVARKRRRDAWVAHVIKIKRSALLPEVKQAYLDHNRDLGLQEALDRELLVRDISASTLALSASRANFLAEGCR